MMSKTMSRAAAICTAWLHYGKRAVIALVGLGAILRADAVYPSAYVDGEGKPLSGANRYLLHFDKGQTPPFTVARWSHCAHPAPDALARDAILRSRPGPAAAPGPPHACVSRRRALRRGSSGATSRSRR
jgi:hypothetical protein